MSLADSALFQDMLYDTDSPISPGYLPHLQRTDEHHQPYRDSPIPLQLLYRCELATAVAASKPVQKPTVSFLVDSASAWDSGK